MTCIIPETIGPVTSRITWYRFWPITNWPPSDDTETGKGKKTVKPSQQSKKTMQSIYGSSNSVYTCSEEGALSGKV